MERSFSCLFNEAVCQNLLYCCVVLSTCRFVARVGSLPTSTAHTKWSYNFFLLQMVFGQ